MTNEPRWYIELSDIVGIEFECGHCHARLLYSLAKAPDRVVGGCLN